MYSSGFETVVKSPSAETWEFELYVNDRTWRSLFARENLNAFCEEFLDGHWHVNVFDLAEHPELGFANNICVTPTLIKRYPSPVRTLVGDLSDTIGVLRFLDIPMAMADKIISQDKAYHEGLRKQGLSSLERHVHGR
jgi:circadian clock protein KaiB